MQKIDFKNYKIKQTNECKYYWQEQALQALEYLENPKKSQVFKWFKTKEQKAVSVLRYMQDKNIKSFKYFAACLSRN